jgi:hypothetical protein
MNAATLPLPLTASRWTASDLRDFVEDLDCEESCYTRIQQLEVESRWVDPQTLTSRREALMRSVYPVRKRLQYMKREWARARFGLPEAVVARVESRITRVRTLQAALAIN